LQQSWAFLCVHIVHGNPATDCHAALSLLKIAAAAPELVREILNGNEIDNDIITVTSLPMAKSERNSLMTA
jgi:hypothetical protein